MSSISNDKTSDQCVSARILELRRKIQDEAYIDNAVQRIALVLSRRIVEKPKSFKEVVNGTF